MPEVKKLSLGQDNYPKAQVRRSKPAVRKTNTAVKTTTGPVKPQDTFQSSHQDANMDQQNELRRRAAAQRPSTQSAPAKAKAPDQAKPPSNNPKSGRIDIEPGYPQAGAKTSSANTQVKAKAPLQNTNSAHSAAQASKGGFKPRYQLANTITDAKRIKFNADMDAQIKAKARPAAAPQPKAKAQVKKPQSSGGKKLAAGGAVNVVSGALTIRNGVKNISQGNYGEGGFQLAQGGVSVASGANDINLARKGLSGAPATKLTSGLKVAGGLVNGGMALYDGKQAYNAIKSGNEVLAADKASSAVINAVSAFPPTAVIGAIGGVADWAMAASGADDAMINAINSSQDKAYQKRIERDMQLAQVLVKTPTSSLAKCNREQKQAYIRGIQGLKEYRQQFAAQGNTRAVEDIDAHIARVKGAWSR